MGVYTPKQSKIKHCIFFITEYMQSQFLLTLGRLDIIKIVFDWCKIRISVFYMREHIELVYIRQNKVENAFYIFLPDYIQSNYAF